MIHFQGYTDNDIVKSSNDVPQSNVDIVQQDSLLQEIFAPDPVTGKPRSDLHFVYSKDYNPVVSEYIRQNLARPINVGTVLDDPEDALILTKSRFEDLQEYSQRLQEIISEPLKSE